MPLHRRLPKRGFTNVFKKEFGIINVRDLDIFEDNTVIDTKILQEKGLVGKKYSLVKLLGSGEVAKKMIIKLACVSESAKIKIEAVGGKIEA